MSAHADNMQPSGPWYTYPWVWFVIAVPFSAVLFGIVMIVSANHSPDDLVVDNYYKEGKSINMRIGEDTQAARLGASATLDAVTDEGVVFTVNAGGDELSLVAYHVTDRSKDLTVPLQKLGQVYTGQSPALAAALSAPGIWYLEVRDEAGGWRLRRRVQSPVSAGSPLEFKPDE